MAFPTAVNDQITDSVTQRQHNTRYTTCYEQKLHQALTYLGTKWVLHPQSTYKPKWCAYK